MITLFTLGKNGHAWGRNSMHGDHHSYRHSIAALSLVGFLLNFQPSEPYLTEYMHRVKALSMHEVNDVVYPWSTWSNFITLLPAAALAECWGYRRTIIAGVMLREAARVLLIFGVGLPSMVVVQCFYGCAMACTSVYFAFAYRIVPQRLYLLSTGCVSAAYSAGNVLGSLLGYSLVSYDWLGGGTNGPANSSITGLFYVSWAFTTLGLLAAFRLPPPLKTLFSLQLSATNTRPPPVNNSPGASLLTPLLSTCPNSTCGTGNDTTCAQPLVLSAVTAETMVPTNTGTVDIASDRRQQPAFWSILRTKICEPELRSWHAMRWATWWTVCAAANQIVENYYQVLWLAINSNTQAYGLGEAMVEAGKVLGYVTPAASVALLDRFRSKAGGNVPGLNDEDRSARERDSYAVGTTTESLRFSCGFVGTMISAFMLLLSRFMQHVELAQALVVVYDTLYAGIRAVAGARLAAALTQVIKVCQSHNDWPGVTNSSGADGGIVIGAAQQEARSTANDDTQLNIVSDSAAVASVPGCFATMFCILNTASLALASCIQAGLVAESASVYTIIVVSSCVVFASAAPLLLGPPSGCFS